MTRHCGALPTSPRSRGAVDLRALFTRSKAGEGGSPHGMDPRAIPLTRLSSLARARSSGDLSPQAGRGEASGNSAHITELPAC
jgi:hypothetical protein